MADSRTELFLYRHAGTAWEEIVRPWLERGRGSLQRAYMIVPTRGQAHGWKQRCVMDGLGLLGVEFLSPGLARKKWMASGAMGAAVRPALGRELLLMGLRAAIEQRLKGLDRTAPERGLLKSLQSDPEGALDDFDELLKAGFRAEHFPAGPLVGIFNELAVWVERLGYELAPRQAEVVALAEAAVRLPGRVLVHGLSAEMWSEFFNVAAFVRCFGDVTVGLPEPEFRGQKALDEVWVELWEKFLAVPATHVLAEEPPQSCEAVAELWTGKRGAPQRVNEAEMESTKAAILVGRTRGDEMWLVADKIARQLAAGAENIGVVFPASDAAHLRLVRLLGERGVAFVDQLETAGTPPVEVRALRALLAFVEGGGRLEELLALWPLLRVLGRTELVLAEARDVCARLFDERQVHALATYREFLDASKRPEWREVGRVAALLPEAWPAELTLGDGLRRFREAAEKLELYPPAGWPALEVFASRETQLLPAKAIFGVIGSFLPEKGVSLAAPGKKGFARVTLTTRRRAEGIGWSHLFLVEANAGVWPERRRPSCWLTDERRAELNATARPALGVLTSDDRAWLEKRGYATLARDTARQVVFSAALFDEEEPEMKRAPNSWLERVLWDEAEADEREGGLENLFERRAQVRPEEVSSSEVSSATKAWWEIWCGRRDPARAFDEYFLCVDPAQVRPERLAARAIERAVKDPAELWFGEILEAGRVEWTPFVRQRRKVIGQLAHRVLAASLRPTPLEGAVGERLPLTEARKRLGGELGRLRADWPRDRYWDSFHAELAGMARTLLEKTYGLMTGPLVAVELALPRGVFLPLGASGERLEVYGRMDLVLLDRTEWNGAAVDIVDFKTGADAKLSAERMARDGGSLQLGIYLAAARELGAKAGRVWMLKADTAAPAALDMEELDGALMLLERLGRQLREGRYGALTPDRSEYAPGGVAWPLACVPIAQAVLRGKFVATFGESGPEEGLSDE